MHDWSRLILVLVAWLIKTNSCFVTVRDVCKYRNKYRSILKTVTYVTRRRCDGGDGDWQREGNGDWRQDGNVTAMKCAMVTLQQRKAGRRWRYRDRGGGDCARVWRRCTSSCRDATPPACAPPRPRSGVLTTSIPSREDNKRWYGNQLWRQDNERAVQQDNETTRGWRVETRHNNQPAQREEKSKMQREDVVGTYLIIWIGGNHGRSWNLD